MRENEFVSCITETEILIQVEKVYTINIDLILD